MEPLLHIYSLGSFELHYPADSDGPMEPLRMPATLKSQALLAYLLVHRRWPHSRAQADLFWGDRPERKARRSLSTALWQIHRCLPRADLLLCTATSVQFDPRASLWLDIQAFETLAAQPDLVSQQGAVDLYRGDFLNDFYDDWVISERSRLESLLLDVLARLMAAQEALGDHAAALAAARQLLDRDPLREDAHRIAMRAHCQLGQRHAALSQYLICQQALRSLPPALAAAACAAVPGWVVAQVTRLAPDLLGQASELPGMASGQGGEEQERLFEAVSHFLAQLADQQPLLLILEDLHWASDSTLQLLHYLARHLVGQPLLLVGTVRP
ncbi:MAG TPA: BTAD domain-containing putative transcriptional regulator [Anaerolineae bacterium]|nr:BTAD domain-containing putative transcriptional regulator [Anaerolineae bacterium]